MCDDAKRHIPHSIQPNCALGFTTTREQTSLHLCSRLRSLLISTKVGFHYYLIIDIRFEISVEAKKITFEESTSCQESCSSDLPTAKKIRIKMRGVVFFSYFPPPLRWSTGTCCPKKNEASYCSPQATTK